MEKEKDLVQRDMEIGEPEKERETQNLQGGEGEKKEEILRRVAGGIYRPNSAHYN